MRKLLGFLLLFPLISTAQVFNPSPGPQFVNTQTNTSYTVLTTDFGKLVTFSNAGAVAVTLPQCSSSGFYSGWWVNIENLGAGTVTVTPTTSTIDGASSLAFATNTGSTIVCNPAGNYATMRGSGASGSVSGQANGVIPLATAATAIGAQSHMDDGVTTAGTITSTEPFVATAVSSGTGSTACGSATGCFAGVAGGVASTQTSGQGSIRLDSTNGWMLRQVNGAAEVPLIPVATGSVGWLLPIDRPTIGNLGSGVNSNNPGANVLNVQMVYLPFSMTVATFVVNVTTLAAASHCYAGIYSIAGSKLVSSGAFDSSGTGVKKSTVTGVLLQPGFYYDAVGCDSASVTLSAVSVSSNYSGISNADFVTGGSATNTISGGALPATLGALTGTTDNAPLVQIHP